MVEVTPVMMNDDRIDNVISVYLYWQLMPIYGLQHGTRGVDHYGTGGTCPPNILEVMSFGMSTRVTATVVCSILMQILCVVSRKKLQLTGALSLDPAGGLCPPDLLPGLRHWGPKTPSLFLCPPNNPVRSTPLCVIF